MPEGFKLLDAYVEVTASGKGLAEKVGQDFQSEAPSAAKQSSASFGANLLAGFKALPSVGGSVAHTVGSDFEKAAPEEAQKASSSFGSRLLGGMGGLKEVGSTGASFFGSAFAGILGGLASSVGYAALNAVGNTVSAITGMLADVGSLVAKTVIDFNSELQNATIGFTTMLGSGQKAQDFLMQLQEFAKTTPFEFGNLVSNAQQMMGMGIAAKNVIPDLTALGDSVAAMGGSAQQVDSVTLAFDQMNAKGTLDMGNMNQLMQNGVPSALKVLAASYHTTTGNMIDMISTGKVQADVALPALVKGIERGTTATRALGGMMDKQSSTFTGALSNIQDGLTQTVSKAFKPFFDVASGGMLRFANSLSGKPAEKFQKDVTKALKPLADDLGKWFKGIDFDKIFTDGGKAVTKFLKDIKPKDVTDALNGVKDVLKEVADGFKDVKAKDLIKDFKDLVDVAKLVVKALKDWAPVFVGVIKWFVDTTGAFADGASQWKVIFGAIGKWFGDTVKAFQDGFNQIAGFFSDFEGMLSDAKKHVSDFITWMSQAGANLIQGFINGILGKGNAVSDAIGHIADIAQSVFYSALQFGSP